MVRPRRLLLLLLLLRVSSLSSWKEEVGAVSKHEYGVAEQVNSTPLPLRNVSCLRVCITWPLGECKHRPWFLARNYVQHYQR